MGRIRKTIRRKTMSLLPDIKELQEYIHNLPPASQNNSRSIVRKDFEKIRKLPPTTQETILAGKYGIFLEGDRTANDYGGEPEGYGEPNEQVDISDDELAEYL